MKKIDVLYQFNEKYAPYAGVSITSLLENNTGFEQIRFFVLGENLSGDSVDRLRKLIEEHKREVRFIDSSALMESMKKWGMPPYRGSYAANLRLFLPYLLEEDIDEVLYLDADTIVQGNLEELIIAAKSVGEYALYMALDSLGMEHKYEIGLQKGEKYFNSGVILFRLSRWKQLSLSDKIVQHVKQIRANYPAPDQDLLNVVCRGEIGELPPEFNYQPVHVAFSDDSYCKIYSENDYYTKEQLQEARKAPCIYHFFRFMGEFPWDKGNRHPDGKLFDLYLKHSPWKDYEKKKAHLSMVFRVEKIMYILMPGALYLRIFKAAHKLFIQKSNKMSLKNEINPDM